MSAVNDAIGALSGRRPSRRAEATLGRWLLPEEPILGALAGQLDLASVWFILTPTGVVSLRDRSTPTVDYIPYSSVVGWQCEDHWGNYRFLLNTDRGMVKLNHVNTRYVVAFGQTLGQIGSELVGGVPEFVAAYMEPFAALADLMPMAFDQTLQPGTQEILAAGDLMKCLTGLLRGAEPLSYGVAQMLFDFMSFLDPHGNFPARNDLLQAGLEKWSAPETQSKPLVLQEVADSCEASPAELWSQIFGLLARIVAVAHSLLPRTASVECRDSFAAVQYGLQTLCQDLAHIPATDTSDVVAELTRLQTLRESGALSDEEFEMLKARLLAKV